MSAIEVLRDWLLAQGSTPKRADELLGRTEERVATVPHLLELQRVEGAPEGLIGAALSSFDGMLWTEERVADVMAKLEEAADQLEEEHGDSLDWLYASGIPDGPWLETLSKWEALRDHPGSSSEETDTVMRHLGTGILVQLVHEDRRGWVGRWLSLPVQAEEWPVATLVELVEALFEAGERDLAAGVANFDTIEALDLECFSGEEVELIRQSIRVGIDRDKWPRLPRVLRELVQGRR